MKLFKVILRPEKEFVLKDVLSGIGYHGITSKDSAGLGESKKKLSKYIEVKYMSKELMLLKEKN